jgi:hypothetical protein
MATGSLNHPRLLKAAYLADTEGLLKETRATALYYLPGPILAVIVAGILDYGAASARYGFPSIPWITQFFLNYDLNVNHVGPDAIWTVVFGLLLLLSVLWLLVRYLRWISTVYAITTHRVIIQKGILGREFDEIPIPQVRGVDVRQTVLQRMLRYGTIKVSSEGGLSSVGNEDWVGIPRPFDFQRLVESASQAIARGAYNQPPAAPNPRYPAAGMNPPRP